MSGTRKFFYGDLAIMTSKIHYPRHVGHKGVVVGTQIVRLEAAGYTKVNYKVDCECGARLSPKGGHMDLSDEPIGDEQTLPVHELRMEHFLNLIQSPIKNKNLEQQVATALAPLKERDKYILVKRFGLDGTDSQTLRAIGFDLGITKQRVNQLEQSLIERLRRAQLVKGFLLLRGYENEKDEN